MIWEGITIKFIRMKAVVGWCTKTQPHEFRIDRSLLLPFINTTHTRLIMSQPQNHEPLASFYNLCELFERLANTRGTDLKKRLFQRYLHDWRHHFGYDFYDAMRLFLPHVCTMPIEHVYKGAHATHFTA